MWLVELACILGAAWASYVLGRHVAARRVRDGVNRLHLNGVATRTMYASFLLFMAASVVSDIFRTWPKVVMGIAGAIAVASEAARKETTDRE